MWTGIVAIVAVLTSWGCYKLGRSNGWSDGWQGAAAEWPVQYKKGQKDGYARGQSEMRQQLKKL